MQQNNRLIAKPTQRGLFAYALAPLLIAGALSLPACSKPVAGAIHLKSPSVTQDVPVKSGGAFAATKSFTDVDRNITTAPTYRVYVANYDLDTANFAMTMNKPLAADDHVRIVFSLVGEVGGNDKTPLKVGTYSAKADKHMKVEDVSVVSRKGGPDIQSWLERNTITGDVKVASVAGDTIVGEIDLVSGETTIKGPFTAKILTRK